MALVKSASVMIFLPFKDFSAAFKDFLIKASAAPEGMPRAFAWIFKSDSVDFRSFSSSIRANLSQ